ncbi:N-acetylmuramoyl-L-alanine amidase [Thermanaeromonas toyohensis ToBE]|uniref:N-acetylmuramoyl-L-alanine amidase n=1 Tax=Thermanaeromonas toyohensis ToBE TaxID=698762 RepID=A0A1W1VGS1_9FIRM|nr:N-acetylmuramoyl-L-alanine amidase [Thermanaeromonas toyohensis]SMB92575.1 N-acetylmuramoyl-L-alanine amidase [Thermanaeromonas toyohensis ToBE]
MLKIRQGSRVARLPWRQGGLVVFCLLLWYIGLVGLGNQPAQAGNEVKVYINGNLLTPAVPPYLDATGRTMIPIRAVMEYMGAQVEWKNEEQKVIIQRYGNVLELWIGKKQARLNGRLLGLDTVPVLKQDTTMVPARVVAESFGALVEWDEASFSVYIWLPEKVGFEQVRVTGSYVNIRSGPGLHYEVQTVVEKGTLLQILGGVTGWYQVRLPSGEVGWISAKWVEPLTGSKEPPSEGDPGEGGVTPSDRSYVAVVGDNPVAVLEGPGPVYRQVAVAPAGAELKVKSQQSGWVQVELDGGRQGFLPLSLVTLKPIEKSSEPGQGGGALVITGLEVIPVNEGLKVWVQATQAFKYNSFLLSNPTRLVVDIPGALLGIPRDRWQVEVGKNGISRLRLSQYTKDTVRLVFDLEVPLKLTSETALGGQGLFFYLSKPSLKGSKIVLDPGHGTDPQGPDPGAIGPTGVKEKDVNLAIALKLAQLLRAEGARVYLTREGESTSFSLAERAYYANDLKADVFISIHSNSSLNPAVGGTATYIYAPPGTELEEQRDERLRLARCIQESLVAALGLRNIGILEANFSVLRNTQMPSVLVEVAFISNPEEEKLLNDPAFQAKAAAGILEGLRRYFK